MPTPTRLTRELLLQMGEEARSSRQGTDKRMKKDVVVALDKDTNARKKREAGTIQDLTVSTVTGFEFDW